MRRTLVAALVLLGAAVPVAEAKPRLPVVGAYNTLIGWGSSALDVTVPKGAKLLVPLPEGGFSPGFAQPYQVYSNKPDTWGVVALISRTHKSGGRPVNAVHVHTPRPDHCPAEDAPTVEPPPACRAQVEHTYVHGVTPTQSNGMYQYALPPGTYQLIISGPQGSLMGASLFFSGAKGYRYLITKKGIGAAFDRARSEHLLAAHTEGSFGRKLSASGIAVLGLWHTTAEEEPGEFTYSECMTAGDPAPLNPDDCVPVGMSGQAPDPTVAKKPVFWAGSTGGVTLEGSGTGTFQTPILKKGTYFNTYRVTRGGRGPAAGVFAWWVIADSLK